MRRLFVAALMICVVLSGCSAKSTPGINQTDVHTYTEIDQEKAKEMMKDNSDLIIVDVRRQEEYDE